MNDEITYRINNTTFAFMTVVTGLFDFGQVASKILTLAGLTVAGGILGAIACYYANIDLPESCAVVGGIAGAVATFTGIGTAIALKVGMMMSWLADLAFAVVGRMVIYFWLQTHGVSVFSGTKMQRKVATTMVTSVVGIIPFLATLPDLTVWTITIVLASRAEDKEKAEEAKVGYNRKNFMRVQRHVIAKTS